MNWVFAFLAGYLVGSVPFGLLLARAAGKGDIRQVGSGNIGATNALRAGGKKLGAAVLLLDLAKGLAAVLVARHLWPDALGAAAVGAIIGHCFPLWLRFRGGKGVATMAGVSLGLFWPAGVAFALVWIVILLITRISSLGGMTAAVAAPIAAAVLGGPQWAPWLAAMAALVLFQHRANIARLLKGEEPQFGKRR
ncbi:glycerol-3-phosphate 1-O-acyltransferase PlsY [Tsuneonella sp. HG222]